MSSNKDANRRGPSRKGKVQLIDASQLFRKLHKNLGDKNCEFAPEHIRQIVEYETDSDLRDTENVPLKEQIHDYFLREVRPHVNEAWINLDQTKIGYEISFNKYFYQHKPLRSLEEVTRDFLALEAETDGLLKELVSFAEVS